MEGYRHPHPTRGSWEHRQLPQRGPRDGAPAKIDLVQAYHRMLIVALLEVS